MAPTLSLIIPAYNEATRIETGYTRLAPALERVGRDDVEVIIVDDGSSDDTGRIAAKVYGQLPHSLVVRREVNEGKGAAFRLGVAVARSHNVIVCDADMAIDPVHVPDVLEALGRDPLAFGSRAIDGKIHYTSWVRTSTGAVFNAIVRRETGTSVRDTQCGFKGFTLGAARALACFGWVDGFAYDVELLFLASQLGMTVGSVGVTWDDVSGSSVRLVSDSRKMLRDIRQIRRYPYEAIVVRVNGSVDSATVRTAALSSRLQGAVIAHGDSDAIIVLPHDGALSGVAIAEATGGTMGVATPFDVADRRFEAV